MANCRPRNNPSYLKHFDEYRLKFYRNHYGDLTIDQALEQAKKKQEMADICGPFSHEYEHLTRHRDHLFVFAEIMKRLQSYQS
jgi:hypothetical protein